MELHQPKHPENAKPLKGPEGKILHPKKPKKRRKIRRPSIKPDRSSADNEQTPQITPRDELWAWPRLKQKKAKKLAEGQAEVSELPEEPAVTDELTAADQPPDYPETVYLNDQPSQELSLEESSDIVVIPLDDSGEHEVLLHDYLSEANQPDIELSVTVERLNQVTLPQSGPGAELQPSVVISAIKPLETSATSNNAEDKPGSQAPVTEDETSEQTIPLPLMQAQETVDNQLLLKPDLLKNSSEPAQLPIDNEDTVFNPALISPADYQQASPDRPLAATQPSTPPGIRAHWWQQLHWPKPTEKYSYGRDAEAAPQPLPTPLAVDEQKPPAPGIVGRTAGLRPSVSEFTRQLKARVPLPAARRETPAIIDQLATSRPVKSITQLLPNLQPQLVEAGGPTVGSMNHLIKNSPYYPENYRRIVNHDQKKNNEVSYTKSLPEYRQEPGRLQVDEDKVIPSAMMNNLPAAYKTEIVSHPESIPWSDKSWDEIVAIEAEKLRIGSLRQPESRATVTESVTIINETVAGQPPEIPPDRLVQNSVWHRIEIDASSGKAVEAPTLAYGKEFRQEQRQEKQLPEDKPTANYQSDTSKSIRTTLPVAAVSTSSGADGAAPAAQSLPNQVESTIRVRRTSEFNSSDLWLWVILIIVIFALAIAINV
ncbi:MAG TPA: hypothetical protein VMQ52_01435 [Candidatus Saccharimonadales bacterium]|jgi:hypothetical protein|nr:hypothetical protein [Candidatus Saccharimonadales bacterium]